MKKISLITTQIIFCYWMFSWIWNFAADSFIYRFHPINLLFSITLSFGFICIWRINPTSQLIAGSSGVITSLIALFQSFLFSLSFQPSPGVTYSTHFGPIEFKGTIAIAIIWIVPVVLLFVSTIILWGAAQQIDENKNQNRSPAIGIDSAQTLEKNKISLSSKAILNSISNWFIVFMIFLILGIIWLHYSHAEVYDFLQPSALGISKTIDNAVLNKFYNDRHLVIIISIVSSLIISQTLLLISIRKK